MRNGNVNTVCGAVAPIALGMSALLKEAGNEPMSLLLLVHGVAMIVFLILGLIEDFMEAKR